MPGFIRHLSTDENTPLRLKAVCKMLYVYFVSILIYFISIFLGI